ncbi:kinase-like domain-containing protein [Chiua virens]|nr:kinase-like domain-containing protein [Chiua virens]
MASSMARVTELNTQRAEKELAAWGTLDRPLPEELDPSEIWWRDRYNQLSTLGYRLRPRYSPEWVPSWKALKKDWADCEDGKRLEFGQIIDATRVLDGRVVTLKRVSRMDQPYEVEIGVYFSSEPLISDPANHCVPIYDVLSLDDDDDDTAILVMPLLRAYTDPNFDTIGEAVECFRQLFEGLQFMHRHHVAHRDCMNRNIMLDPTNLYPELFHPVETSLRMDYRGRAKHLTRTQRPPKYYLIDFGISRRYDPSDTNPREVPIWGGDKDVPEFQNSNQPLNPFPTDVFYIGNAIRKDFLLKKRGFEFMKPLMADMIQHDPDKRPNIDEVVSRFNDIRCELSGRKLRSRPVDIDEGLVDRVVRTTSHWSRRIVFIVRGTPAIPNAPDI